jgi:phosphatidate phosphatase APP1
MFKLIVLLFISTTVSFGANYILVSDLDDTLKMTNGKKPLKAFKNMLRSRKIYAGMDILFQQLSLADVHSTYLLSASPNLARKNVNKLVKKYNLDIKDIYLRKLKEIFNKKKYKIAKIEKILNSNDGKVILLGDNYGEDEQVYLEIRKRYPTRIHKIFIHNVGQKNISKDVISYYSSYEIAYHLDSFLTQEQKQDILDNILSKKMNETIPYFANCPIVNWNNDGNASMDLLQEKIVNYCKKQLKL